MKHAPTRHVPVRVKAPTVVFGIVNVSAGGGGSVRLPPVHTSQEIKYAKLPKPGMLSPVMIPYGQNIHAARL